MKNFNTKPKTIINISRIISIHYNEFGPNFVFDGERHDFWEIVYVDKGNVKIRRDDEDIILKQGEIVFHKPNEFHSIKSFNSAPNFFVITFICDSKYMKYFVKYRTQLDKRLKTFFSSVIREAKNTYLITENEIDLKKLKRKDNANLGGEQLIKTYIEQLLIFILRDITKKGEVPIFPQKEENESTLVSAIKAYLAAKIGEVVYIEDICYEFGYSRSFLTKLFKEETGETLASFATKLKIKKAKQYIRESNFNFAEISDLLAFENPQYFSRVFKRHTGMTPTEFKNKAHI